MIKHGARRFTVRHGSAGRSCQFVENGRIHQEIPYILRLKVEDFLMEIFGKFVTKPSRADDRASIAFFFLSIQVTGNSDPGNPPLRIGHAILQVLSNDLGTDNENGRATVRERVSQYK